MLALAGVGIAVVVAVIAFVAFVATSGGDTSSDSPTTRPQDSNPVDTGVDPTTPDVTTPIVTAPIVTGDQLRAALLTVGELEPEWVVSSFTDTGDDVCGQLPSKQPVTDQTVAFDRFLDTPNAQSLLNTVSVYSSSADADAVFEESLSIAQNCTNATQVIGTVTFNLTFLAQRLDATLLSGLAPECDSGALILANATDPISGVSFSSNIYTVRCKNVLDVVLIQAGASADPATYNPQLAAAIGVSTQKVVQLPLQPG